MALSALALLVLSSSTATASPPGAPRSYDPPDPPPPAVIEPVVVIADGGDLGLSFRFGGLATLGLGGATRVAGENFPITQVALKYVGSRAWHFAFFTGFSARKGEAGTPREDTRFGFDLGFGLEYHFRIWRRISPFIGLSTNVGYFDEENEDALVTFAIGPELGIEYFVADRLSLGAKYTFVLQLGSYDDDLFVDAATLAGGAANVTFYF